MAYVSDESGRREVYVRPFPRAEGVWEISTMGGEMPRWRGDGQELYYVALDGKMMAVGLKVIPGSKPSLEVGAPAALFDSNILADSGGSHNVFQYDVSPDGKRFLINTDGSSRGSASPPLTVWVNWLAGARK